MESSRLRVVAARGSWLRSILLALLAVAWLPRLWGCGDDAGGERGAGLAPMAGGDGAGEGAPPSASPPVAGSPPASADPGTGSDAPQPSARVEYTGQRVVIDGEHVCWIEAGVGARCRGPADAGPTTLIEGELTRVALDAGLVCALDPRGALHCAPLPAAGVSCDDLACPHQVFVGDGYRDVSMSGLDACVVDAAGTVLCAARGGGEPTGREQDGPARWLASSSQSVCALLEVAGIDCPGEPTRPGSGTQLDAGRTRGVLLARDGRVLDFTRGQDDPPTVRDVPPMRHVAMTWGGSFCGVTLEGGEVLCSPEEITPPAGPFEQVSIAPVSPTQICGLRATGPAECWGGPWGSGADEELCDPYTMQLQGTVEGEVNIAPDVRALWWSGPRAINEPLAAGWVMAVHAFPHDSLLLRGQLELDDTPLRALADGEQTPLRGAVLHLGANATEPGSVYCAGAGSGLRQHGSETRLDLQALSLLGSCPGTPVAGELTYAPMSGDPLGDSLLSGSVEGIAIQQPGDRGFERPGSRVGAPEFFFPQIWDGPMIAGPRDGAALTWALIVTREQGPLGGAVYCAGSSSTDGRTTVLGELSRLGTCADATPLPDAALQGCIRE